MSWSMLAARRRGCKQREPRAAGANAGAAASGERAPASLLNLALLILMALLDGVWRRQTAFKQDETLFRLFRSSLFEAKGVEKVLGQLQDEPWYGGLFCFFASMARPDVVRGRKQPAYSPEEQPKITPARIKLPMVCCHATGAVRGTRPRLAASGAARGIQPGLAAASAVRAA